MHPPTERDNFLRVAQVLLEEASVPEEKASEWAGCENARSRAAISRAYYGVFLRIKYAVIPLRPEWARRPEAFPQYRVHGKLGAALRAAPSGHRLSRDFFQLADARKHADYAWNTRYGRRTADAEVRLARRLVADLDLLADPEWQTVADRLFALDA